MEQSQASVALRSKGLLAPCCDADVLEHPRRFDDHHVRVDAVWRVSNTREHIRNCEVGPELTSPPVNLLGIKVVARRSLLPQPRHEQCRLLATHSAHASSYRRSSCR